jgi:hypothetical protein
MQSNEENKRDSTEDDLMSDVPSNLDLNIKKKATLSTTDLQFDVDRLKIYYEQVFPYQLMFKWISYSKYVDKENRAF